MSLASPPSCPAGLTKTAAGQQESASGEPLPPLSEDLAQQHSYRDLLFVTWTNQHFVPFAANWAHYARAAGINNFLVGELLPCACRCPSGLTCCWEKMAAMKHLQSLAAEASQ